MGRATIASGGDSGLYTAEIDYDATATVTVEKIIQEILDLQGEVSLINTDISALRIELRELESEYHARALDYQTIIREMSWENNEFVFYPPSRPKNQFGYTISAFDPEHLRAVEMASIRAWLAWNPDPVDSRLSDAFIELARIGVELWKLRSQMIALVKQRGVLMYRIAVLQKRQEEIDTATQPGEAQSMWCADLTEDLSGEVDTIEIKGAPDQILIGPAGVSGLLHNGNAGKLANIMAMSPAGAGLAWALLPGWQKWRPTYRVGAIHTIDYAADTASVTLDEAISIAQSLLVNQTTELAAIPVEYMECNAKAFDDDDRVVVEFPGQGWETGPKVIGFETNPQPCGGYAAIFGGISGVSVPNEDSLNVFAWNQGTPAGGSPWYFTPTPASDADYNNAWKKGATVQIGARWRYPFQFVNHRYYKFLARCGMRFYGAGGSIITTRTFEFGSGAMDKGLGNKRTNAFKTYYLLTTPNALEQTINPLPGDPCYDLWFAGEIPSPCRTGTSHPVEYRAQYINDVIDYRLRVDHTDWDWIDPVYMGCSGEQAAWEIRVTECDTQYYGGSGPGSSSEESAYLNLSDPCGVTADPASLFLDQSWSIAGVIDDTGVTLEDSMAAVQVHGAAAPFGPFAPLNANAGPHRIELPPISEIHHVGFFVLGILTADDSVAAIVSGSQPNWWTEGGGSATNGSEGYLDFYGLVDRTRR